jgi:hypothetical protein
MSIKRIIREEIDRFKDSTEEDWEWVEGDIDLKHILETILEGTHYFISIGNMNREPIVGDKVFIYEKGYVEHGHYSDHKRDETIEDVLKELKRNIGELGIHTKLGEDYTTLHDIIEQRYKELFNL